MKKTLVMILAVVMLAGLAVPVTASSGDVDTAEEEMERAREAGEAWLDSINNVVDAAIPKWKGAHLTSPQSYHNLNGELTAYMFGIANDKRLVGHVLIGSSVYGYPVFEAGEAPPFSVPSAPRVASLLEQQANLKVSKDEIGEPTLVLLDILRGYYAVYELESDIAVVNVVTEDVYVISDRQALQSQMPSPEEYKAAKKKAPDTLGSGWGLLHDYWEMEAQPYGACGPSSGVSIGDWQRDWDGDVGLHASNSVMYTELHEYMNTWPNGFTAPDDYANGFENYGAARGEYFDVELADGNFEGMMDAIDNGWPSGAFGYMEFPDGTEDWHWVAVKGYNTTGGASLVYCTDSYISDDDRWIDWDTIPAPNGFEQIADYDD